MDSLSDLLKNKTPSEPEEFTRIKDYVKQTYDHEVSVSLEKDQYIVYVTDNVLSTILHYESLKIAEACKLDKKLIIRVQ